jgi:protein-S-isoprenylcysteine O-methyltransferase Ste14
MQKLSTGTFINAHKILVTPLVLGLMAFYSNWSTEAFVYLALHGTYSLLWLLKQTYFPDRRFAERLPFWIGVGFVFTPLAGYYLAPYLLISRRVTFPPYVFAIVLFLYIAGIFFHYVSDAQKFYILRERKGLIEDGLFTRTRNPNYLGEILIYVSFAIMSMHWIPFIVLGAWVFGFFARNMLRKDRSLARHPGFAEYKTRTGLLFPRVFPVAVDTGSMRHLRGRLHRRMN